MRVPLFALVLTLSTGVASTARAQARMPALPAAAAVAETAPIAAPAAALAETPPDAPEARRSSMRLNVVGETSRDAASTARQPSARNVFAIVGVVVVVIALVALLR